MPSPQETALTQSACKDAGPSEPHLRQAKGETSRESPPLSHSPHLLQVRNEGLQPVQLQVGEAIELREEGHGVVLLCHWAQTREW